MNVIKKVKDLFWSCLEEHVRCYVMCDVVSQPSTFQFFDAKDRNG